jgi:hypothetical protein
MTFKSMFLNAHGWVTLKCFCAASAVEGYLFCIHTKTTLIHTIADTILEIMNFKGTSDKNIATLHLHVTHNHINN